jgi:hypothetical protein
MVEKSLAVTKITPIPYKGDVYNLHIKDNHNYFADSINVKNCHLFKAKSLTDIMTKLNQCVYRFGFTGTLDGTQTNKLVLEGLFGPVKKVTTTAELIEQKYAADFNIKCLVLKHPDEVKKQIAGIDYQTEIDYIVTSTRRNRFIKNLALSLEGNTLLLFQFVEKQGKPLFDIIKKSCDDRSIFYIDGSTESQEREKIRNEVNLGISGNLIKFDFGNMLIPDDIEVLLTSGEKIKAKQITKDTDISEKWIGKNKNLYKYP